MFTTTLLKKQIPSSKALGAIIVLAMVTSAFAAQIPPFADSITWSTGKEAPSLNGMRGKSVVIVFFQSWCGICNKWSPGFFRQVGEKYKNDPKVVLVALKTDGSDMKEATDYLKSRTDLGHWLVGTDKNASYYRQVTGNDKLYKYVWVNPKGEVSEVLDAGGYFGEKNAKRFVLASDETAKALHKGASTLIDENSELRVKFKEAVRFAEVGMFLSALKAVSPQASNPKLKNDVSEFRKVISDCLQEAVETNAKILTDENNLNRYSSYLSLVKIKDGYGKSAPALAARKMIDQYSHSDWVEEEEEALKDYQSIMRRATRADDPRSRKRISKSLKKLADEFPNTMYGRMAAASLKK